MSRSQRAWLEGCALASIGERAGLEEPASLGCGPLLGAVSFTQRLVKLLVASMLLVALAPASALASPGSGQHASSTQKKQQSTHAQAGVVVLAPGNGYFSRASAARVRALQRRLARAGDSPGPIDGRYGPLTEQAVIQLQAGDGLREDGIAGPLTLAALSGPSAGLYPGAGYASDGSPAMRALQRRLARAGDLPGPIDGRYGPRTERAVTRFQAAHGLRVDGIARPRTLAQLVADEGGTRQRAKHPSGRLRQRANRPSGQLPLRPRSRHSRVAPAPARSATHGVRHSAGSSSSVWLVLIVALVLLLLGGASWRAQRRRGRLVARSGGGRERSGAVAQRAAVVLRSVAQRAAVVLRSEPRTTASETGSAELADDARETAVAALKRGEGGSERSISEGSQPADRDNPVDPFVLGLLLEARGDLVEAAAAYERADQRGHAAAACNLGALLEEQGDLAGAERAYRRADHRGDATGAFNLGVLLEQQGDLAGASTAYQRADQRGHAAAACNLGVLLEEQGDVAGAEATYRRADRNGDANGTFNLGVLLEQQGDLEGALRAYRRAEECGTPEVTSIARAAAEDLHAGIAEPGIGGKGVDDNGG